MKNKQYYYEKYLEKFKYPINKGMPLTEGDILKSSLKEQSTETGRILFEQKYYPKLKEVGLIFKFDKNSNNIKILRESYGLAWKDMIRNYYVFTPQTAKIGISFIRLIEKFREYIEDEKRLTKEINIYIETYQKFEAIHRRRILSYKPLNKEMKKKKDIWKPTKNKPATVFSSSIVFDNEEQRKKFKKENKIISDQLLKIYQMFQSELSIIDIVHKELGSE